MHTPVKVPVPQPQFKSLTELTRKVFNLEQEVRALKAQIEELKSAHKEEAIA